MALFPSASVVWVRCGALHWPATVVDAEKDLDQEMKDEIAEEKRQPKFIVKFFNEDGYEYVYDDKNIFEYNCPKKEEFIKKGVAKSRSTAKGKDDWFSKFPRDIELCEELTGGDVKLLEKPPFVEEKTEKVNYKAHFGGDDAKKAAASPKKAAAGGRKRKAADSPASKKKSEPPQKQRPIVHPRFKPGGSASDHQVKVMLQPSTPYHLDLIKADEKDKESSAATPSAAGGPDASKYNCSICGFSTSRQNVIVLHNKTHTAGDKAGMTPSRNASSSSSATPKGRGSAAAASKAKPKTPVAATTPKSNSETPSRGRGRPAGSLNKKKAGEAATPAKTTPARKRAVVAATATTTPAADETAKSVTPAKRGRGRPKKEEPTAVVAVPVAAAAVVVASPKKKPRMTIKRKEEMAKDEERKKEEKKKLLGDWSDNDDEEKGSGGDDEAEDAYAFMDDDNVVGNVYEGEEEEEEKERKEREEYEKEVEDKKKKKEEEEQKKKERKEEEQKAVEAKLKAAAEAEKEKEKKAKENGASNGENGKAAGAEKAAAVEDVYELDISKVLEETSMPSLPTATGLRSPRKSAAANKSRKSVSFSTEKPKEMKQKTMAVVQPESNLELGDDDVYDEFVNPREIAVTPPKFYQSRRILMQPMDSATAAALKKKEKTKVTLHFSGEAKAEKKNGVLAVQETMGISLGEGVTAASVAEVENKKETEEPVPSTTEEKEIDSAAADAEAPRETVIQLGKDWSEDEEELPTQSDAVNSEQPTVAASPDAPVWPAVDQQQQQQPADQAQPDVQSPSAQVAPVSDDATVACVAASAEQPSVVAQSDFIEQPAAVVPAVQTTAPVTTTAQAEVAQVADVVQNATVAVSQTQAVVAGGVVPVQHESVDVAASGTEQDTYLILVDEGQADALDSQTLYIDPSQLANGDLSNMVLMTEEGVAVNVQGMSAEAGGDQQQMFANALNQQKTQQAVVQQQTHDVVQQQQQEIVLQEQQQPQAVVLQEQQPQAVVLQQQQSLVVVQEQQIDQQQPMEGHQLQQQPQ